MPVSAIVEMAAAEPASEDSSRAARTPQRKHDIANVYNIVRISGRQDIFALAAMWAATSGVGLGLRLRRLGEAGFGEVTAGGDALEA